mmetsp:Transcript_21150/g.37459  ORF Transcript_21150/g.37459 Transcript_21150/m.37459 type:complete len:396 (-) Transcript_21150:114-1301(-)
MATQVGQHPSYLQPQKERPHERDGTVNGQPQLIQQVRKDRFRSIAVHIPQAKPIQKQAESTKVKDIENLVIMALIGKGSYSDILLAAEQIALRNRKESGTPVQLHQVVALKVVRKARLDKNKEASVRSELAILETLKTSPCPFLANYVTAAESQTKIWIGLEFYPGGDFRTLLNTEQSFSEDHAAMYMAEVALALSHLHSLHIIFRDLKPENITIAADGHLKLIDFGHSLILAQKKYRNPKTNRFEVVTDSGTLCYCAPEILWRMPHSFESDWWSLGVVLFEVLTGRLPWFDENPLVLSKTITTGPLQLDTPHPSGQTLSVNAKSLLSGLLEKSGPQRLGYNNSAEILEHPFFSKLDMSLVLRRKIRAPVVPILEDALDVTNFDPALTGLDLSTF